MAGEPIIGANVTIKGQSIGTITDIDGRFIINARLMQFYELHTLAIFRRKSKWRIKEN